MFLQVSVHVSESEEDEECEVDEFDEGKQTILTNVFNFKPRGTRG